MVEKTHYIPKTMNGAIRFTVHIVMKTN